MNFIIRLYRVKSSNKYHPTVYNEEEHGNSPRSSLKVFNISMFHEEGYEHIPDAVYECNNIKSQLCMLSYAKIKLDIDIRMCDEKPPSQIYKSNFL